MRKSCIQIMKKSRLNSLDHNLSKQSDTSFDGFHKNKFAHRITQIGRSASEQVLEGLSEHRVSQRYLNDKKQLQADTHKLPEYQFLKNKNQVDHDPFLKAKMKYLIKKQRPILIRDTPKLAPYVSHRRNNQNNQQEAKEFTTLKKQYRKQENKKIILLHYASAKSQKGKI